MSPARNIRLARSWMLRCRDLTSSRIASARICSAMPARIGSQMVGLAWDRIGRQMRDETQRKRKQDADNGDGAVAENRFDPFFLAILIVHATFPSIGVKARLDASKIAVHRRLPGGSRPRIA